MSRDYHGKRKTASDLIDVLNHARGPGYARKSKSEPPDGTVRARRQAEVWARRKVGLPLRPEYQPGAQKPPVDCETETGRRNRAAIEAMIAEAPAARAWLRAQDLVDEREPGETWPAAARRISKIYHLPYPPDGG